MPVDTARRNSADHADEASDEEIMRLEAKKKEEKQESTSLLSLFSTERKVATKQQHQEMLKKDRTKSGGSSSEDVMSSPPHSPTAIGKVPSFAVSPRKPPAVRRCGNKVYANPGDAVSMMLKGLQDRFDALEATGSEAEEECNYAGRDGSLDLSFIRLSTPLQFNAFLKWHGVDLTAFDSGVSGGTARSLRDLWLEVIWQTTNLLRFPDPDRPNGFRIQRLVRLCIVELMAEINGEIRLLVMQSEGHRKDLNQRLASKMFLDENEDECLGRCILQNFFMDENVTRGHLELIESSQHEEIRTSAAYPGMNTLYDIHTLRVKVHDSKAPGLDKLGLPTGQDFSTEKTGWNRVGLPSRKRIWAWLTESEYNDQKTKWAGEKKPSFSEQEAGDKKAGYPSPSA